MQHEPRGLLRDAYIARELTGANPLLVRGHQEDCHEPLLQADLAVLEDGAVPNAELLEAIPALVGVVLKRVMRSTHATVRAGDLVRLRPAQRAEVVDASILIRECNPQIP